MPPALLIVLVVDISKRLFSGILEVDFNAEYFSRS